MRSYTIAAAFAVALAAGQAGAATVTTTSPTSGGTLPSSVSVVGGIVFDLIGLNGARVVSQLAASSLYEGFNTTTGGSFSPGLSPLVIGTQFGFDESVLSRLGGGLRQLAVRITLLDGDTAPGDFDDGDNALTVNGTTIGNFSSVSTVSTDSLGALLSGVNDFGFADRELDTGFFFTDDASILGSVFASLSSTGAAAFAVTDVDPGENFFDFTQGLDGSVIDIGTGPVVTPPTGGPTTPPTMAPVPLPAGLPLILTALGALGLARRRRKAA